MSENNEAASSGTASDSERESQHSSIPAQEARSARSAQDRAPTAPETLDSPKNLSPEAEQVKDARPTISLSEPRKDVKGSSLSSSQSADAPESQERSQTGFLWRLLGQRGTSSSKLTPSGTSKTRTSEVSSSSRRPLLGYASAFLISVATLGGIINITRKPEPERAIRKECFTRGCYYLRRVIANANTSVSPCDDFFNAVCLVNETDAPKVWPGGNITSTLSKLSEVQETIFLKEIIRFGSPELRPENYNHSILDSELQMGKFVMSCHQRHESTDDSRRFFLSFLNDLGIPMEFGGDKQLLSMFSALVRLSLVWGIRNPLLYVELRPVRAAKYYITVIRTIKKDLNPENITHKVTRFRREEPMDNVTSEEIRENLRENVEHFASLDNLTRTLSDATDTVRAVFSGSHALDDKFVREMIANYGAVLEFLKWRHSLAIMEIKPYVGNFKDLETLSMFPWRQALTYGVRQHLNLSRESEVVIERPLASVQMLYLFMDPRYHRPLRMYLYVWLLVNFRFAMGKEAEGVACNYEPAGCLHLGEDKESYCHRKVREYFPRSYVALVNRTLGNHESAVKVNLILSILILSSANVVMESKFLHGEDKLRVLELLATMVIYLANPEYLNELRAVEYNCGIGRNFFQNIMLIRKNRNEEKLITFEQSFYLSGKRWPHMPIGEPESHYDVDLNCLTVPATIVTFPHYISDAPIWFNVAGMGWNVVSKIFRAFSKANRESPVKEYRRIGIWNIKTSEEFEKGAKCFTESYQNISEYFPAHMSYADEAIADNAAVQVLYDAFEFVDKHFQNVTVPTPLQYRYPDVYWVAAVKPFCFTTYEYADKVRSDMFSRARVNYALKNKFPPGFQCKETSSMRSGKCALWAV